MARYQLVIDAAGRVILSAPEPIEPARARAIKTAFDAWREAQPPELLIVPESEVVRVLEVELALEAAG